jgi:PAS domain S-box-containing protein
MDPIEELPLPYVEIDAQGVVTRANRASLELCPSECGQLVGLMAWKLVAPDEKDLSFAAYCTSIETGKAATKVRRSLFDRSGQFRTYEMYRSLVRDAEGNPEGMRMVCVDVSAAEKEMAEMRSKGLWLESVMDSICIAIVVTDAMGFIRSVNPAAEALLGWKAADLMGMPIEEGLPIESYLSSGRTELPFTRSLQGPTKGVATALDRDGHALQIEIKTSPIFDKETRSTTGVVLVLREMETAG